MSDSYPAIHLYRDGDHVVVAVEAAAANGDKRWVPVIRELHDSPFSHIVEPGGIEMCVSGKHKGA